MEEGRLISTHGQFVCYDRRNRRMVAATADADLDIVKISVIAGSATFYILLDNEKRYLSFGPKIDLLDHVQPSSTLSIVRETSLFWRFTAAQLFLSADPDGTIDFKVWKEVYEKFFVLFDGSKLDYLLSHRWCSRSQRGLLVEPRLVRGFEVSVGGISFDIHEFESRSVQSGADILCIYNAYCVERLSLYRPLIYVTAFGNDDTFIAMKMFLESVLRFGRFEGEFLIITDRPESDLIEFLPLGCLNRTLVRNISAFDVIDYVSARFAIHCFDELNVYQPIVYCDVDIICSASLSGLLETAMQGDQIYTRSEGAVDLIHYGSAMMDKDPFPMKQKALGFNSGVIAFKNIAQVKALFAIILGSLTSHLEHGLTRHATESFDQPVANYVFNKVAAFDVEQLTAHVHPCLPSMDDLIDARGLIHFFGGVGASHKLLRMRRVLDRLQSGL